MAVMLIALPLFAFAQQDPVQVVRTYITTLNDALSSPNDMTRRRKIENLLDAGKPGIKDQIVEIYNTKSTSRMLSGQYLAIFYDEIQNSSTHWIKVSIIDTPTVNMDSRGITKVYATLQYTGAISLKTSSEFWIKDGKITGIMSDEVGIAEISSSGDNQPSVVVTTPDPPKQTVPDKQPVQSNNTSTITQPVQQPQQPTITKEEHEWVDLGLPSGTLWATCNVGASSPEEYGDYFAWGEISKKSKYDWVAYKYCNNGDSRKISKYCTMNTYGNNGYADSRIMLERYDDAANQSWGNEWCIPTKKQWLELHNKCTWTWTTRNGKKGYDVRGPNYTSIFLPAAGYCRNSDFQLVDYHGQYWSSLLNETAPQGACFTDFGSNFVDSDGVGYRDEGRSIRPVRKYAN